MGLGSAVLPLLALVASLAAAVAVGSLVVAWLRAPAASATPAATEPLVAGLLPVGFVSGRASERWLPATVVQLAADGAIRIEDRRDNPDGEAGRGRDVRLVFTGDASSARAGAAEGDSGTGAAVVAILSPGLAGGASDLVRGSNVDVDRVVTQNARLAAIRREGFRDAAERYREPRPTGRFRVAVVGGTLGVTFGVLELIAVDDAADSIAWFAVLLGAGALVLRALLPRWIPLNDAGLRLRERADELRASLADTSFRDVASGEQVLPWALLLDEPETVRRFVETAERSGGGPDWYTTTKGRFSADRLASCLALISAELTQPVRIGGRLTGADGSRSGVPLVDDHKGWGGGYFAGDGGGGYGGGGYGGDGGGYGGDGGGFGGGGFDGGGFGGGDGGGGGGP